MKNFLDQSIAQSKLSTEFKLTAELFGFHTFGDIVPKRSSDLLKLPGFTKNMLYEYVNYVEKQGFGQLIDP